MSKEFDKFSAGLDTMSMFDNDIVTEKPKNPSAIMSRKRKPSRKQVDAVREARNENRGRGKSLGERRGIFIRVTPEMDRAIADAMYDTGRTQNDVICDAIVSYLKIDK